MIAEQFPEVVHSESLHSSIPLRRRDDQAVVDWVARYLMIPFQVEHRSQDRLRGSSHQSSSDYHYKISTMFQDGTAAL